ncbi:uncharacterized protein PGTG_21626 [Puccinia graminis f. sp. tritici CRL 75-36-700-3]|uniref:Uncharacterized protein n=1 Tax=Puccinia graminis f. sp. tritici (strain CRL 75-36-700-3 / race SCCL) TaxID=418459 RepID=H6QRM8_PUCGT|nr:uncharacterized protein PGTG_21626 [Puccinia graminis f. sp. tritici CRL 75-36-700-3]EHS63322.1 hypothetical protein PGTG_21626 [Puccinia graminis f. sp. tritici CRL 75-36-700-3]
MWAEGIGSSLDWSDHTTGQSKSACGPERQLLRGVRESACRATTFHGVGRDPTAPCLSELANLSCCVRVGVPMNVCGLADENYG